MSALSVDISEFRRNLVLFLIVSRFQEFSIEISAFLNRFELAKEI
jgi:hypothetical protein